MSEKILFSIDKNESIVIEIHDPLKSISCCYFALIYFLKDGKKYCISEEDLLDNLSLLKEKLQQALERQLEIDKSLQDNEIGLQHVQYVFYNVNEIPGQFERINGEWVGQKYHVWGDGFGKDFTLWIYNKDAKIILEITPTFTEDYFTEDETPNFVAYEKFIQSYKPLVKRIISKEIAQQWLEQANEIIQMIESNIQASSHHSR